MSHKVLINGTSRFVLRTYKCHNHIGGQHDLF
nr:MAG TPA: hypothetical protein [Caudoviricetes sp.]